ncbi:unnamed protein product [Cylindrotheca closterium]|uniref:Uncharacterized protein n=1 Tax=Cylindrotheca closterium TaxID=2856 RepID=A0AAD2PTZ2_9STRA|nr:unnamed protein product [Cylindrotheca closterium]
MVSNTSSNTICDPTLTMNTGDDSLLHLMQGRNTARTGSSSFSSTQESSPRSNHFRAQDTIRILDEAIKIVTEDDLFFPSNDIFMSTHFPDQDGSSNRPPRQ